MDALRSPLAVTVALFLITLSGCSDDDSQAPEATGVVSGTITELGSGEPVTDAVVALLHPASLSLEGDPAATSDQGAYDIPQVAPGTYSLVVYHDSLVIFDRTARLLEVEAGVTTTCDARVLDSDLWGGNGYQIAGTVRDEETGRLVSGAFVERVGWAGMDVTWCVRGTGLPDWAATDAAGQFEISATEAVNEEGETLGLLPFTVTKSGYEPFTLVGEEEGEWYYGLGLLPVPEGDDKTLVVDIGLRPLDSDIAVPGSLGALSGRVTFLGFPAAGVSVGLSIDYVADPDTLVQLAEFTTPLPDKIAVTDEGGVFLIGNLTSGIYYIHAGYQLDDGYVSRTGSYYPHEVTAGDTTDAGDIAVELAITPALPGDHSVIDDITPEFRWAAIPDTLGYGFLEYELRVGVNSYSTDDVYERLQQPSWQVPDDLAFARGDHVRWSVSARAFSVVPPHTTVTIAAFEAAATFSVSP
jgi:hypothetical protein